MTSELPIFQDPPEWVIQGARSLPIFRTTESGGATVFSKSLKRMTRVSPDVQMQGEQLHLTREQSLVALAEAERRSEKAKK